MRISDAHRNGAAGMLSALIRKHCGHPAVASIRPASSFEMLALLASDMSEAEQAAVWALVHYLREKEVRVASAQSGACPVSGNVEGAARYAQTDPLNSRTHTPICGSP